MSEWKPIESAPKDGRKILLWFSDTWRRPGHARFGHWLPDVKTKERFVQGGWVCGLNRWHNFPTHWMPLPEPPDNART